MTTTTALPLNVQARAMLKELHRQTGVLPQQVDAVVTQHIEQAAQTVGGTVTALDCDALEKILVSAMPDKKQVIENAKAEPSLTSAAPGQHFQWERVGYFFTDAKDSKPNAPVFNRVVALKDGWKKS